MGAPPRLTPGRRSEAGSNRRSVVQALVLTQLEGQQSKLEPEASWRAVYLVTYARVGGNVEQRDEIRPVHAARRTPAVQESSTGR